MKRHKLKKTAAPKSFRASAQTEKQLAFLQRKLKWSLSDIVVESINRMYGAYAVDR